MGRLALPGQSSCLDFRVGKLGRGLNKLQKRELIRGTATGSRFPVKTCVPAWLLMQL